MTDRLRKAQDALRAWEAWYAFGRKHGQIADEAMGLQSLPPLKLTAEALVDPRPSLPSDYPNAEERAVNAAIRRYMESKNV